VIYTHSLLIISSFSERKHPGVSTKTHSINFANSDHVAFGDLTAVFGELEIGVLGKCCWDVFMGSSSITIHIFSEQCGQIACNPCLLLAHTAGGNQ